MPNDHATPQHIIALTLVRGAGRKTIHDALRLAARRGCPLDAFFGAPLSTLLKLAGPGEESAARALAQCGTEERERAAWLVGLARDNGFRHCAVGKSGYPEFLTRTLGSQTPPLLFFQGNEALLESPGAGIVGTRRPSREGADWARTCAETFAEEGIAIISGGADGVDMEAHKAAIRTDGGTVIVLPEGLHAYDPPKPIRSGVDNGQVLLLSEFLPTDDWQTHRAMTRNRTVASLSSPVCVIEPRESGGSMFTAEQALARGKPVFYWGGACRDGALRDEPMAFPLPANAGRLDRRLLIAAAQCGTARRAQQSDLFSE